jgi:hypothetical protein
MILPAAIVSAAMAAVKPMPKTPTPALRIVLARRMPIVLMGQLAMALRVAQMAFVSEEHH